MTPPKLESAGRRRRGWITLLALAGVPSLLAACPGVSFEPTPKACRAFGEKCQLPAGPLGVCDRVPCSDPISAGAPLGGGATPGDDPCLRCVPQH